MNIAIFTDTYTPQINGVVTSTLTFKRDLEARGHTVIVGSPKVQDSPPATLSEWRFASMAFPFQKEHRMTSPLSQNLRNFEDNHFDIIHVQTPFFMGHLGQYLGWRYNIPVIHTYHTYWEEYLHYFPLLPKKICKLVYNHLLTKTFCNRCAHLIVPSHQMAEKLPTYGITTPISVIPTGIETPPPISEAEKAALSQKLGLNPERRYLIFVGRLGLEKNIPFLIEMFAHIARQLPDVDLLILGDGPEKEHLKIQAESLGIGTRCLFPGYVSHAEVFVAYSIATLIVFASKTETQGLSLLEGLAVGKPAVCIQAMGIQDILAHNNGGFLSPEEPVTFANFGMRLLTDPELYAQKAQEAQSRAQDFSSQNMTLKLESVYQNALSRRPL